MKLIHKLFFCFLYVLLFITSWFSSDLFVLSLKDQDNIYFSNNHIADIVCILVIMFGFIIRLNMLFTERSSTDNKKIKRIASKLEKFVQIAVIMLVFLLIYGVVLSSINGVALNIKDIFLYKYRYYIYAVILFNILVYIPIELNKIKKLLNFFIIINLIKCFIGIYNYLTGSGFDFLILGKVIFAEGDILLNVTYALSISFAMFLSSRVRRTRMLYILSIAIFIGTISISMRRTTLLTIVILFFINLLFSNYKNKLKIITMLFLIIIGLFVSSSFLSKGDSGFDIDSLILRFKSMNLITNYQSNDVLLSDNGHVDDILDAIDNVKENPIIGKGIYTPVNRYRVQWQSSLTYFHNGFLAAWVGMGILGFLTYISIIISIMVLLIRYIRKNEGYSKYLSIAFLCIVVSNAIQTNVAGSLYDFPVISLNFFVLLALVINTTNDLKHSQILNNDISG